MKNLAEVIIKVQEKYMDRIKLTISKSELILNYIVNEKTYKTLRIEELEDKLKVLILPERIEKVVDLRGLEDIITILDKQSNVKNKTSKEIEKIKEKYVEGTKIKLIKMYDLQEVEPNTKGFIENVDDVGTLNVVWENGRRLGLIVGVDEFVIICPLCNQEIKTRPALSRSDNKTEICSDCGTIEALAIFEDNVIKSKKNKNK